LDVKFLDYIILETLESSKLTELEQAIQAIQYDLVNPRDGEDPAGRKIALLERMKHYKVPGVSVAFVYQEELAWAKGFGVLEASSEKPVTHESIFQAASISKPVTAMVALHLVEAGMLDLDAEVNEKLRSWKVPESPYTRMRRDGSQPKVTLRGLLSHSAGLTVKGYLGYTSDRRLPTLQQILSGEEPANSKPVRVVQRPGKGYKYSSGGYMAVQQLIEDVTGRPLAVLAKEFIFDKLGMANSTFDTRLPQAYISRAATGHNRNGKPVPGKWHTYPEQAAASLWTTPSDLARLIVEILKSYKDESNLVLSAEMTHEMLTPQANIGIDWDCGLAFNLVQKEEMTRIGHPGWNEGFHSIMLGCLETGQGLIWMTNGENGRRLGLEISRGLAEVVRWSWW
jgi:CubicO group peptidase (beta-lactamase class C family)